MGNDHILFIKAGPVSSKPQLRLVTSTDIHGHVIHRYHRTADVNVGGAVETAESVHDMSSAAAYWEKHFLNGGEKTIAGKHGTKSFTIHVTFQGNHAYTDDRNKTRDDGKRLFDLDRAKHMHFIWLVLSHPTYVGPSKHHMGKRQLDKEIDIESSKFGRVVLAPSPSRDDIKNNRITHWTFVSWHLPSQKEFSVAAEIANRNPTKPDSPMRKADDFSSALSMFLGHRREMSETDPGETCWLQGEPNASTPFDDLACQNSPVKHATDSAASVNQGTYLGKAIKPSHEHDIWLPFDSPYLADLVEAFTHNGQTHIQSFKDALSWWLASHGTPHLKDSQIPLIPDVPVHWTPVELHAWSAYFHAKPRYLWQPEDWSMLVEWLLQSYWSPQWAASMADWVAVKSTLLGQIEAGLAANPPSALVASSMAAMLPASIPAVIELGLPVSKITEAMIAFAQARCAQAIVDIGDHMRSGIKALVLDHQMAVMLGGKVENLEQKLFDKYATANRDWRRIAITEVSENAAQGVVAASQPGDKLKRLEMYRGVCAWCHKINGKIMTVVDPTKPNKDGENEVWPGKTNIGRSSAPRKLVAGQLHYREPDEMWWIAAGAQHPHCRGRWLPFTGIDTTKYDAFMATVKASMAKYQAQALAGS